MWHAADYHRTCQKSENFRVPPAQRRSLSLNRLLYLSPFSLEETRTSVRACLRRNQMVAALAEEILFVHASPGGKSQRLFDELIRQERKVHVVQSDFNRHLVECGAQPSKSANWQIGSAAAAWL
jgi:predicted Rossmann fold nucleotide-binding protein DprA/Smf involved in DNA uptake